jgi:hypothetical protein
MPRLTEQDKVLVLSKLEEEWTITKVATHDGLKKALLEIISKENVRTRWDRK